MRIDFKQLTREPLQLDVAEDATVGSLKSALASHCQTDPSNLALYLHSYRLRDTWTASEIDLKEGCTIYIRILRGHPIPSPSANPAPAPTSSPLPQAPVDTPADANDPITILTSMGFPAEASRVALGQANGDIQRATDILTNKRPPPTPAPPDAGSDMIEFLTAAGFSEGQAMAALQQANGNPERALDLLLSGSVNTSRPPQAQPQPQPQRQPPRTGTTSAVISDLAREYRLDPGLVADIVGMGGTMDQVRAQLRRISAH
jgi:hypothetical protein